MHLDRKAHRSLLLDLYLQRVLLDLGEVARAYAVAQLELAYEHLVVGFGAVDAQTDVLDHIVGGKTGYGKFLNVPGCAR